MPPGPVARMAGARRRRLQRYARSAETSLNEAMVGAPRSPGARVAAARPRGARAARARRRRHPGLTPPRTRHRDGARAADGRRAGLRIRDARRGRERRRGTHWPRRADQASRGRRSLARRARRSKSARVFLAATPNSASGSCAPKIRHSDSSSTARTPVSPAVWSRSPNARVDAQTLKRELSVGLAVATERRESRSRPADSVSARRGARSRACPASRGPWSSSASTPRRSPTRLRARRGCCSRMSYALLVIVGWTSWQQVSHSLAKRIEAIKTQLRSGIADESHESFEVAGHELRELADSVSAYIKRTLDEKSSSDERYRKLVELAPDAVLMCADTRIRVRESRGDRARRREERERTSSDRRSIGSSSWKRVGARRTSPAALRPGTFTRLDGARSPRRGRGDHRCERRRAGAAVPRARRHAPPSARSGARASRRPRSAHGAGESCALRGALDEMLASTRAPRNPSDERHVVAIYLDLDGFKPVNDTHGHAAGDAVLMAVADATSRVDARHRRHRAAWAATSSPSCSRFVISRKFEASPTASLAAIREPIATDDSAVSVGASLGIASTQNTRHDPAPPSSP